MPFNIGAILEAVATIAVDITVDEAELAAGTAVTVPFEPQVGTAAGKAVYLTLTLSEAKSQAVASAVVAVPAAVAVKPVAVAQPVPVTVAQPVQVAVSPEVFPT